MQQTAITCRGPQATGKIDWKKSWLKAPALHLHFFIYITIADPEAPAVFSQSHQVVKIPGKEILTLIVSRESHTLK